MFTEAKAELIRLGQKIEAALGPGGSFYAHFYDTVDRPPIVKLDTIIVPKAARGQGLGSKAVEALTRLADERGYRLVLVPASRDDFHGTTSRSRLVRFYRQFGFVENKGRRQDSRLPGGSMVREPRLLKSMRVDI